MSERLVKMKDAIEAMHHCTAMHVRSDQVIDLFRGELAWDELVETFDIDGHPEAKRCYAWSFLLDGETQYTVVLEIPPVHSPESALMVAVAAKVRQ